jgi:hypothetical protein
MGLPNVAAPDIRETSATPQKPSPQPMPPQNQPAQPFPLDVRRGSQMPPNYNPSQHGEIGNVPHNAYPTDGMTMFCRTGPPSERSSAGSVYRPSSREDSQSDISNPTSFSSQEPPSGKQSPTKPTNGVSLPGMTPEKQVQKKRSAFFSNSPFRRKSRHDKDRQSQSHSRSPTKPTYKQPTPEDPRSASPEPVDPRANFQLNVGNNVFDVASPDQKPAPASKPAEDDLDPIARALAELKGVGKPSVGRVSADRYHGIATPAPSAPSSTYGNSGTADAPPPSYNDPPAKRLDAPQPAFTSAQMQKTTQKYVGQTQNMFGASNNPQRASTRAQPPMQQEMPRARSPAPNPQRAPTRAQPPMQEIPRARSPAPTLRRSASPQPAPINTRVSQYNSGGAGPRGGSSHSPVTYQSKTYSVRSTQSPTPNARPGSDRGYSPQQYSRHASPVEAARPVSPRPSFAQQNRPASANGMELQLSGGQVESYRGGGGYDTYGGRGRENSGRPQSMYYGNGPDPVSRSRSKSIAVADPNRPFGRDGRPILHFGKSNTITTLFHTLTLIILACSTRFVQLHGRYS